MRLATFHKVQVGVAHRHEMSCAPDRAVWNRIVELVGGTSSTQCMSRLSSAQCIQSIATCRGTRLKNNDENNDVKHTEVDGRRENLSVP